MKKIISVITLTARIRRRLLKDNHRLTMFSKKYQAEHGQFGIIDLVTNSIIASNVDLEVLGKELGVLHGYEEVEDIRS